MKIKHLDVLDLDGKPDILTQFKIWLNNPYRFYENVELFNFDFIFDYEEDELKTPTINQIIDRVSSFFLWFKATNRIKGNPVIYRNVMTTNAMRDKDMLSHTRRNRTAQKNALKSKVPQTIPKTIDQKDFKRYLNAVNLLRDKIILLILKEGGLRSGEPRCTFTPI